jgi:hypothetical protein
MSPAQRRKFVAAYRQWADAPRAALAAGCPPDAADLLARRWLGRREVRRALAQRGLVADRQACCQALTEMIQATPGDLLDDQGGVLPPAHWRLPHAVREFTVHQGAGGVQVANVKLYDKLAAIRELARLLGWDGEAPVGPAPVTVVLAAPTPEARP